MQTGFTLKPLDLGDILDYTFKLYRRNLALFLGIQAAVVVPTTIIQVLLSAASDPRSDASGAIWIFASIVLSLPTLLSYGALIQAISARYLGHEATVGGAYGHALPRFLPLLGAGIVIGILLMLSFITLVGPLYLGIRWALFAQATVLERTGVVHSMRRSWGLVGGYWWKTFLTFLVMSIIVGIANIVLALVLGGILGAVGLVSGGVGAIFGLGSQVPSPGVLVMNGILSIVLGPFLPAAATLLYYDLRVRKEGYDLEMMANELSGSPSEASRW